VKIGEESSWQIEYMPGFFQRVEHVRIKYACRGCEQNAMNPNIELADKPVQPIEKGMAGPGLLAYVVTSKFADYLPLYRLENIFARNGFEIDRVTQCLWCRDVADIVKPLYDRMGQRVLASHVIQTDDTVMPMLQPGQTKQARMWVYVGDQANPYNLFDFTLSRSRDGPAQFLKGYNQTIVADAYGGYDGICLEAGITQAGCWAHARRKFVDTRDLSPKIADEALLLIGKLFAIEQQAKELSIEERQHLRQSQSQPIATELRGKLLEWKQSLLPKHPVAGAINYCLNQWKPLTTFLTDGAVAIHNNIAEQEMKRIALNRKNSLFVGNPRGGQTAAILSSFTSTCRRHGINPQIYFTQLLTNLSTTPLSQLDRWLPDQWKPPTAGV
jgi:transposase